MVVVLVGRESHQWWFRYGVDVLQTMQSVKLKKTLLFYDVNNRISRRSWARNKKQWLPFQREMKEPDSQVLFLI